MNRAATSILLVLAACSSQNDEAVFSPPDSEFKVTFPGKPVLSEVTGQGGLFSVPTKLKVATRGNQHLMLKADAVVVQPQALRAFTADHLTAYGLSYAENQGFEGTEAKVEEKPFGRCLTVRGGKKVDAQPITYLMRMCFGSRTIFTQYIASPSSTFPPSGAKQFLDSLQTL